MQRSHKYDVMCIHNDIKMKSIRYASHLYNKINGFLFMNMAFISYLETKNVYYFIRAFATFGIYIYYLMK